MNLEALKEFVRPYYSDKDIMHDMWHIELTERWVRRVVQMGGYAVDWDVMQYALYFHGFIYREEEKIRAWLLENGVANAEKIIQVAWESQRPEIPETLEGKVLHDAHVLEGGKTYLVVKTLITGSVRGQNLLETLQYMKEHVIGQNHCYLPETEKLCREMDEYARQFVKDLEAGISE